MESLDGTPLLTMEQMGALSSPYLSAHAAAAFFSISATCIRHLVSWDQGWMPSRRQR